MPLAQNSLPPRTSTPGQTTASEIPPTSISLSASTSPSPSEPPEDDTIYLINTGKTAMKVARGIYVIIR